MGAVIASVGALLSGRAQVGQFWDFCDDTDLTSFTGTAISSGTAAALAVIGGATRFSGAATTDNSGYQIQAENPAYSPVANGVMTICARIKASALAAEWIMGFAALDTTLVASAPTDGIYLHKVEDTGEVFLRVVRDSSVVSQSLGVIALASTWQTWVIQVRSRNTGRRAVIQVYLDGNEVGSPISFADVPDDEVLTPSFGMLSGSATGTQTVDVDYLFAAADRSDPNA